MMTRYLVASTATAALALAFFAAAALTQTTRPYYINNTLTLDDSMSGGTPSVSCKSEALENAFQVRCSSHTAWTTVRTGRQQRIDCPLTDGAIHYRERLYSAQGYETVDWENCIADAPDGAVAAAQIVDVTGQLSLCDDPQITAQSDCTYD